MDILTDISTGNISSFYTTNAKSIIHNGSCYDFIKTIPDDVVKLVVTSPPYNIGKQYEQKKEIQDYYSLQEAIIDECVRVLKNDGSICWQVGNYIVEYDGKALTYLFEYIFCLNNQEEFKLLENKYGVEHILPQSGKNIEQIRKDAGFTKDNENEFKYIVDKLGNKIILESETNRNISNAWFRTKRKEYMTSSYKVPIAIAKEYANDELPVWKVDDIEKRTGKVAEEIVNFIFS